MAESSLATAVETGQKALDWFDSIRGDREAGRVMIDYFTLQTLVQHAARDC